MGAPISARIASRKCFMEGSSPAAASISVAGTEERVAGDAVGIREFARSAAWATIACPSPVIIILSNQLKYRSVDDFRLGSFSAIAQRARACSKPRVRFASVHPICAALPDPVRCRRMYDSLKENGRAHV